MANTDPLSLPLQIPPLLPPPAPTLPESLRDRPIIVGYEGAFARKYKWPPYHPDALIQGKGYPALDNMLNLAAYHAPLTVKFDAVLAKDWRCKPAIPNDATAQQLADEAQWHLENIADPESGVLQDFRAVLYAILRACHIGFSVHEIIWEYVGFGKGKGQWGFRRFAYKRPQQIGFELHPMDNSLRAITNRTRSGVGLQMQIPPEKVVLYTYRPEDALPYGRGDARACYKHAWMLEVIYKAWGIALERFGSPFLVGKAPLGDDDTERKMVEALQTIRMGGDAVLPENMEYELVQLQAGGLSAFITAVEYHAREIASVILLNQLTMQQGTGQGSYALGEIHAATQEYGLAHVRRDLEEVVRSQVLRRWVLYNYGPDMLDYTPRFDLGDWNAQERKLIADTMGVLIDKGVVWKHEPIVREMVKLPQQDPAARAEQEAAESREFELKQQETEAKIAASKASPAPKPAASGSAK